MTKTLAKASVLSAVFAAAIATTACTPEPPPPHNEFNITMHCLARPTEKFEGVSLTEGLTLYHVRKYDVVDGNHLRLVFEKNFRKLGCTMERELAVQTPAPSAPAAPKQ